jgi:hypothetical protein
MVLWLLFTLSRLSVIDDGLNDVENSVNTTSVCPAGNVMVVDIEFCMVGYNVRSPISQEPMACVSVVSISTDILILVSYRQFIFAVVTFIAPTSEEVTFVTVI